MKLGKPIALSLIVTFNCNAQEDCTTILSGVSCGPLEPNTINVMITDNESNCDRYTYPDGCDIDIELLHDTYLVWIIAQGPDNSNLGKVTITDSNGDVSSDVWVIIGGSATPGSEHLATKGAMHWDGYESTTQFARLKAYVDELHGTIEADKITTLRLDGNLAYDVSSEGGEFFLWADTINPGVHITQSVGRISEINVSGSGSATESSDLSGTILADGIGSIRVDGDVYATIDAGASTPTVVDGVITNFYCLGDFYGSITYGEVTQNMNIFESLYGTIETAKSPEPTGLNGLTIGDSIESGATIRIHDALSPNGNILINYFNVNGTWDPNATVEVIPPGGSVMALGPGYDTTAEDLGGGSFALLPYELHDESSLPVNETKIANCSGGDLTVKLRHYGGIAPTSPLEWFDIEVQTAPGVWATAKGTFSSIIDPSDRNSVLVTGPFLEGETYQFSLTGKLNCDEAYEELPGPIYMPVIVPVQWTHAYSFTVDSTCEPDFDQDGAVDVDDFFALLQNWGPCPAAPDPCPWDISGGNRLYDGEVGVEDFFSLLQNWGPCPPCGGGGGGMMAMGGGSGLAAGGAASSTQPTIDINDVIDLWLDDPGLLILEDHPSLWQDVLNCLGMPASDVNDCLGWIFAR
jgi:hypothetical protein